MSTYTSSGRLTADDRKKQIIGAAMELFANQGFDGTTTREIATAAGINEALIFRHFKCKEDLYWAVLEDRISRRGHNRRIRELLQSDGDFREVLVSVAETLLDRTPEDAAVTRLLFYSALRNRELSDRFFQTYTWQKFELLENFIRRGLKERVCRSVHPRIAARSFMGMVIYHYLLQELLAVSPDPALSARSLAEEVTDVFINGIAAPKKYETKNIARPRGAGVVAAK